MYQPVAKATVRQVTCLRCRRYAEMTSTDDVGIYGIVRIGHNLYYCPRCAEATGHPGFVRQAPKQTSDQQPQPQKQGDQKQRH